MVNEARRALKAFVERQDFESESFQVCVVERDGVLLRTKRRGVNDMIACYWDDRELCIYKASACFHHKERLAVLHVLATYIGPLPEEGGSREAYIECGGTLTWLALKAALTTGVEP